MTSEAKQAGVNVGRSKDLILGDNFLSSKEQQKILEELDREDPFCVVIAFPCGPWSSLSNFKNLSLKEWEQSEALRHLKFTCCLPSMEVHALASRCSTSYHHHASMSTWTEGSQW